MSDEKVEMPVRLFFWTWLVSVALTLGLFVAVSWMFDRRVVFSTWVKLALAVLMPAGPAGTVLIAVLLLQTSLDTLRESRRQGHPPGAREGGRNERGKGESGQLEGFFGVS